MLSLNRQRTFEKYWNRRRLSSMDQCGRFSMNLLASSKKAPSVRWVAEQKVGFLLPNCEDSPIKSQKRRFKVFETLKSAPNRQSVIQQIAKKRNTNLIIDQAVEFFSDLGKETGEPNLFNRSTKLEYLNRPVDFRGEPIEWSPFKWIPFKIEAPIVEGDLQNFFLLKEFSLYPFLDLNRTAFVLAL